MEQQTFIIRNFLRIIDPDIHLRRMTYPPERREGVREATGNTQISGEERILFKKVVTPNQLFIDTKAQNNVVPIIDLGNVVNYKIRYRITNKK